MLIFYYSLQIAQLSSKLCCFLCNFYTFLPKCMDTSLVKITPRAAGRRRADRAHTPGERGVGGWRSRFLTIGGPGTIRSPCGATWSTEGAVPFCSGTAARGRTTTPCATSPAPRWRRPRRTGICCPRPCRYAGPFGRPSTRIRANAG